jgi:hypothetical protein
VVAPYKPFEQGLKIGQKGRTFKKSPFWALKIKWKSLKLTF